MRVFLFALFLFCLAGCQSGSAPGASQKNIDSFFGRYWEERLQFFPLEATQSGDHRFDDRLTIPFTNGFRDSLRQFYSHYLNELQQFDSAQLDENDQLSYAIFKREMNMQLEGLQLPSNLIPFNQFWGFPLDMGQLGSGTGSQPFKTTDDYRHWISRAEKFPAWIDSAIVYFDRGITAGVVLPRALVLKMIPQMEALSRADSTNAFFGPLQHWPSTFGQKEKDSFSRQLRNVLVAGVFPAYRKMADYFRQTYLPHTRNTSGVNGIPGGDRIYAYQVRNWTTMNMPAEEIYQTGLSEVNRIRGEMERIKDSMGFKGDLRQFFEALKGDKKLMPYRSAEEVLAAFRAIQAKIEPQLPSLFGRSPKTGFEIRQTEAFRAASAAAEYQQGTPDGKRPGIFYIPILDASTFNITSGMESLFLHEAIPGHHYQISLQQENEDLPKFRRFAWYGAYGEGWALYCESLGKELGLYQDPYQYLGALGDEIHRAIRLVVDVAIHTGKMNREEAIRYMLDNEAINEEGATAEIERYMAIPGQALSYKMGALTIRSLRDRLQKKMGDRFRLSDFHDALLKGGVMPMDILEAKMIAWSEKK